MKLYSTGDPTTKARVTLTMKARLARVKQMKKAMGSINSQTKENILNGKKIKR